ncbi:hypothetical protein [Pedobacter sp. ASV12]|uniref:hypothetical protein n=1 Tax=Pedobacter sp. ASV12 TaxID=2795120 RepID=UPI0018EBC146|nr:hypothetical protein [Pedobacter sp. ASV12]
MLKVLFLAVLLSLSGSVEAQSTSWKKYGMENTQLYFFRLPVGIDNHALQVHVISATNQKLPKRMYFDGQQIIQQNRFVYMDRSTNIFYGQKLPFYLPANVWVFAFNYSDGFLLVDDNIKIKITSQDKSTTEKWQLPEIFDMRNDLALSFRQYASLSPTELSSRYISILSLQPKAGDPLPDTTLVYSLKKMPAGIKMICTNLNTQSHATQEFEINGALRYRNELFFYVPIPAATKPVAKHPDQCNGKMTDIAGNIGFASGCITGNGSGKCAGILQHKATKKYKVTIIIEA